MTRIRILVISLVLGVASVGQAEVVFTDSFTADLGQWITTGTPSIESGVLTMTPVPASPGYNQAVSVQQFTEPGRYELQFNVYTDLRPSMGGNQAENIRVTMPGGLELRWAGWDQGANVYFRGSQVGVVQNTWYAWDTYKMILDSRQAKIYRNGVVEFNQAMSSDPDFGAYPSINLYTKYAAYGNKYDNITLSHREAWGVDNSTPFTGGEPGCMALYHFDNSLESAVGGPAMQPNRGSIRYVTGPAGFNAAVEFDATSKPVLYANDGALPASQDLKIDVWVKPYTDLWPSALVGVSEAVIVSKDKAFALTIDVATHKVIARLGRGSSWEVQLSSVTELDMADWYHVILHFDGSDVMLAINGLEEAIAHWPGGQVAGGADLTIGAATPGGGPTFVGAIDELAIISRTVEPWPVNGASHVVRFSPVLRWCPSRYATSYHVYFGTSQTAVQNATPGSPEYKGSVTTDNYSGLPELNDGTMYYWRIDPVVTGGVALTGPVWRFTAVTHPLGLTVTNGVLTRNGKPYRGMGVKYHDAFSRTLDNPDNTTYDAGFAALAQFHIPYVVFNLSGWGTGGYDLYIQNKREYFRRLDAVVASAEAHGIGLIPCFHWSFWTVPDALGESRGAATWADPNSRTQAFSRVLTREITTRYQNSPAIWGWEIGMEWNLSYRSDVAAPLALIGAQIREHDPTRIIESGNGGEYDEDWLGTINPDPCTVISGHWYYQEFPWDSWLWRYMDGAIALGKPLIVGEFGETSSVETTDAALWYRMVDWLEMAGVPLSVIYVYDFAAQPKVNITATNELAYRLQKAKEINDNYAAGILMQDQDFVISSSGVSVFRWHGDWSRVSNRSHSGPYSVRCGRTNNELISAVRLDSRGYSRITVDFWYNHTSLGAGRGVDVQLYDGSAYVTRFTINNATANDTWHHATITVNNSGDDARFFTPHLRVRFAKTSLISNEYVWIDDVRVIGTASADGGCSLRGTLHLEGFRGDNTTVGAKFVFQSVAEEARFTRQSTLNADGSFLLTDIPVGTYDITVKAYASLSTVVHGVSITGHPTILAAPIVLRGNDINGDNTVTFEDFSILQNSYGQRGVAAADPVAFATAASGCGVLGFLLLAGMATACRSFREQ